MWTEKINQAFNESKAKTELSSTRLVKARFIYFLMQKHCKFNNQLSDCCTIGWKVTLAGLMFLNGAEKNYAAVEGECLVFSWSFKQTKYFTKVCKDHVVIMNP